VNILAGFVCYNDDSAAAINKSLADRNMTAKVVKKPDWYF